MEQWVINKKEKYTLRGYQIGPGCDGDIDPVAITRTKKEAQLVVGLINSRNDLLAACEAFVAANSYLEVRRPDLDKSWNLARDAIKKAEGE